MVATLADLNHAVDHHLATVGRLDRVEGRLGTYGSGGVALFQAEAEGGRRLNITDSDMSRPELRALGPEGGFVPVVEFDEDEAAELMARIIARGRFERNLDNVRLSIEELRGSLEALHPDDSGVAADACGKTDAASLPASSTDLEWPDL